jgi:hypothetical protein
MGTIYGPLPHSYGADTNYLKRTVSSYELRKLSKEDFLMDCNRDDRQHLVFIVRIGVAATASAR